VGGFSSRCQRRALWLTLFNKLMEIYSQERHTRKPLNLFPLGEPMKDQQSLFMASVFFALFGVAAVRSVPTIT